ncbi:MAG: hypothetical protein EOP50_11020 [Sphingobacteriales bacterium]|nr:MAG: hypothetical protein EOP50_11020 [Sphingobacteriales bacterium]
MSQAGLKIDETALLFAALFFTLPYVPSNEIERLPLLPAGVFAVVLFAGSRFIRWRPAFIVAVLETLAFATFVWGSNAVANLLYGL